MDDLETGYAETSEQDHHHFCTRCGSTWSHADDFCEVAHDMPGPFRRRYGSEMYCPQCMEG